MLIASAAILIGFIVLVWSADLFVAGAASMAENLGMSPILIGLTIVSLGTSAPEVLVAVAAAMSDAGELAIGNALGSNIANIGLVLGFTAMVAPLPVHRARLKREVPILLAITCACGLLLLDGTLDAIDGLLMLAALLFILFEMVSSQSHDPDAEGEAGIEDLPHMKPIRAWVSFIIGLVLLIASSKLLVWGASKVALELGVSQLVIGLTIVAVGTSLPELAATLASALKGHGEIALGNVVGSNIFNLLGVLSLPGIFAVEHLEPMVLSRDYAFMLGMTVLLALVLYLSLLRPKCRAEGGSIHLGRSIGALLLVAYALYYYVLFLTV